MDVYGLSLIEMTFFLSFFLYKGKKRKKPPMMDGFLLLLRILELFVIIFIRLLYLLSRTRHIDREVEISAGNDLHISIIALLSEINGVL